MFSTQGEGLVTSSAVCNTTQNNCCHSWKSQNAAQISRKFASARIFLRGQLWHLRPIAANPGLENELWLYDEEYFHIFEAILWQFWKVHKSVLSFSVTREMGKNRGKLVLPSLFSQWDAAAFHDHNFAKKNGFFAFSHEPKTLLLSKGSKFTRLHL